MPWKLILFVIVIIIVAIFVGVNHANVCNISFIFTELQNVPVYVTILVSFVVGMLIMLPFTIGKKRGKAPRYTKGGDMADIPTREEYPAESARNRRNRKRQEAAARKAERIQDNKADKASNGVIMAADATSKPADIPAAEIPAITDGSESSGSGGKAKSGKKGFLGMFGKKSGANTKKDASGTSPAQDASAADETK